jgi:hypothetical protein
MHCNICIVTLFGFDTVVACLICCCCVCLQGKAFLVNCHVMCMSNDMRFCAFISQYRSPARFQTMTACLQLLLLLLLWMDVLQGKTFLVMGAGGAGRALAFGAASRGAEVLIANVLLLLLCPFAGQDFPSCWRWRCRPCTKGEAQEYGCLPSVLLLLLCPIAGQDFPSRWCRRRRTCTGLWCSLLRCQGAHS